MKEIPSPFIPSNENLVQAVDAVAELANLDGFLFIGMEDRAGNMGHFQSFSSFQSEALVKYLRDIADQMENELLRHPD